MGNIDLDALGGHTVTMFGTEYTLGDLNVERQDAAFAVEDAIEQSEALAERRDDDTDESFRIRQREAISVQMASMASFVVTMIDDPGDLGEKLQKAIDSGSWGILRLRKAHSAILQHFEKAAEAEGND